MESGSSRTPSTQIPHRRRALPTPCRGLRSPASSVARLPSVGRCLPSLHPALGLDRFAEPFPSLPHSSPLFSLKAWGSSPARRVHPGPRPIAAHPSYFWDLAPGWSGSRLGLGSEGPTAVITALA